VALLLLLPLPLPTLPPHCALGTGGWWPVACGCGLLPAPAHCALPLPLPLLLPHRAY
jgi:hypothetical protein